MTTMWTTSHRPRDWPVHGFQSRLLAIFLGITTTIAVWIYQPKYEWTAIERHYLTAYMMISAGWFEKYAVLHVVDARPKTDRPTFENWQGGSISARLTCAISLKSCWVSRSCNTPSSGEWSMRGISFSQPIGR